DLEGTPQGEVALPGLGSVMGFAGRRAHRQTFFHYTSFNTPGTVFRYVLDSGSVEVFRQPSLRFDPGEFETEQIFCTSKDGTKVPIFVSGRRGASRTGSTPTILYGYGGFRISMTPGFSVGSLAWMEAGGIWAVACIRGGGEYGSDWHLAGAKRNRQNVFDDFMAAAEQLVDSGYTSPANLGIMGGSNGGLLVGACITQRPELFGAAHAAVGVLDMLRFHHFTVGWGWISDYGSPDDPEDFRVLYSYSPLHRLVEGRSYPATIITTGDHDDRVWPGHSLKFAAALQRAQGGAAPVLLRVEALAGHGMGKPTWMTIEELADVRAFLADRLGLAVGADG
ncbi:MAG TPA: prolyl oligopeptidase family serine peptidase, partial [Acidimicrobiales bacterium]|nr:prolyl oligopeptidase family serine peptidase [Acidimicrobiales bacterium]